MLADKIRDTVRGTVDEVANARGRSLRRVLLGVAITGAPWRCRP